VQRLDVGKRYFVYVTNAAGLYHYDMNDIVEVVGHYRQTPLIRFIQKRKGVVFFTAEKLYEVQVIAAVDNALAQLRGTYHFIAAVAELKDAATPRLVFLIESTTPSPTPMVPYSWTESTRHWVTRTAMLRARRADGRQCYRRHQNGHWHRRGVRSPGVMAARPSESICVASSLAHATSPAASMRCGGLAA